MENAKNVQKDFSLKIVPYVIHVPLTRVALQSAPFFIAAFCVVKVKALIYRNFNVSQHVVQETSYFKARPI